METSITTTIQKRPKCHNGTTWVAKERQCVPNEKIEERKERRRLKREKKKESKLLEIHSQYVDVDPNIDNIQLTLPKKPKCPNGTRRNRKGECIPYNKTPKIKNNLQPPIESPAKTVDVGNMFSQNEDGPESTEEPKELVQQKTRQKKCRTGTRRNKNGDCVLHNKTQKQKPLIVSDNKETPVESPVPAPKLEPDSAPKPEPDSAPKSDSDSSLLKSILPTGIMNLFSSNKDREKDLSVTEETSTAEKNVEEDEFESEEEDDELESEEEDSNAKLFKKERIEYEELKNNNMKDNYLYPNINDANFNVKIASKQEFKDFQYNGEIAKDIQSKSDEACTEEFEILPHQHFVRNFMSNETPYNSLLLFHELGTGKTCSAIGIAEETRAFMKQGGSRRKIMVIASPNVQDNFRLQLFDPSKLHYYKNKWTLNTCIGNALLREINPGNIEGMPKEEIARRIRYLIKKYYIFTGYESVESKLTTTSEKKTKKTLEELTREHTPDILDVKPVFSDDSAALKEKKEKAILKIQKMFNNRLIIVDEVHNMIAKHDVIDDTKKGKIKQAARILKQIARFCKHTRFLFLSATPVYNHPDEIISLVNLMNINDNRSQIHRSQILNSTGEFIPQQRNSNNEVVVEGGRELLKRKLIGYVSYVRGENPYTFPYRLYPKEFASKENQWSNYNYPTELLNGVTIPKSPDKYVINNVFVTQIGSFQKRVYDLTVQQLMKDEAPSKTQFMFRTLDSLNILLNMTYPVETNDDDDDETKKNTEEDTTALLGGSLKDCMDFDTEVSELNRIYNFSYKSWVLDKYGKIFEPEQLKQFSSKLYTISQAVQNSTGVVLIYSRYIDNGLLPMALVLEEMGLTRYCATDPIGDLMKTPTHKEQPFLVKSSDGKQYRGKYAMITGTKRFSPNNRKDLEMILHKDNQDGKQVKVVLISEAGSEGIDFKYLRQVHIMDPWYNMSRIEQIIGRGVRNKSHCMLPFEERNVEIYMHGTVDPDSKHECSDMYMYRFSEEKAIRIGKITRVMKEVAVDCLLNSSQQNFIEDIMKQTVSITSSTGKNIPYKVGDKSYSSKCDYMENCEYKCSPSLGKDVKIENLPTEQSTYNMTHLQRRRDILTKRVRQLFREKPLYKRNALLREIQLGRPYKTQEIYYTLGLFLRERLWIAFQNKIGYLVKHQDTYKFQPKEILDGRASMYERTSTVDLKPTHIPVQVTVEKIENMPIELQPKIKQKRTKLGIAKTRGERKNRQVNKEFRRQEKIESLEEIMNQGNESNVRDYKSILTYLESLLKTIQDTSKPYKKDTNTIDEYGKVLIHLWEHDVKGERTDLLYHLVHHLVDTLSFTERLTCLNHLFSTVTDLNTKQPVTKFTTVEDVLYSYYHKKIIQKDDVYGILLLNRENNELLLYNKSKKRWDTSDNLILEKESLTKLIHKQFWKGDELKRLVLMNKAKNKATKFVGYISYNQKDNVYEFKWRDMHISRIGDRTGIFCRYTRVLEYLNPTIKELVGENIVYSSKQKFNNYMIEKNVYCLLYEMLLRHKTVERNEPLFLSPEEAMYTEVQNLAIDMEKRDWLPKTKERLNDKLILGM